MSCTVDIRQILWLGLKVNAYWIVVAHNHPQQTTQPSFQDIEITKNLEQASSICGMKLLDHIIISADDEYYSFADDGVISWYGIGL